MHRLVRLLSRLPDPPRPLVQLAYLVVIVGGILETLTVFAEWKCTGGVTLETCLRFAGYAALGLAVVVYRIERRISELSRQAAKRQTLAEIADVLMPPNRQDNR